MRRTFSAAALAVVLVLLAAACGGSDDGSDTSATATWADEVCSSVTTWTDSLTASVSSLQGGNISRESLEGAADDVKSSTETLVDDLRGARQARHRGRRAGEGLRRPAGGPARAGSREDRRRRRRRLWRQRRAHGDLHGQRDAREHGEPALVDLQRARAARRSRRARGRVPRVRLLPEHHRRPTVGTKLALPVGMGRAGLEPATLGLKVPCSTS